MKYISRSWSLIFYPLIQLIHISFWYGFWYLFWNYLIDLYSFVDFCFMKTLEGFPRGRRYQSILFFLISHFFSYWAMNSKDAWTLTSILHSTTNYIIDDQRNIINCHGYYLLCLVVHFQLKKIINSFVSNFSCLRFRLETSLPRDVSRNHLSHTRLAANHKCRFHLLIPLFNSLVIY